MFLARCLQHLAGGVGIQCRDAKPNDQTGPCGLPQKGNDQPLPNAVEVSKAKATIHIQPIILSITDKSNPGCSL